ncbi:GGDEF domain-containing protein [Arsenicicoccus dermatophilus]|uniref:GGDEF domain-containing protein n=1 Tax=Arsenicicoccus dermatophilus TaxID=1076331 RepID=UPI001F4CE980|nr:GGDEF domain-containing protein [Arsenicicoccus dermatophilus]MCH8612022.1 GGDEF domain-containing protein [Arsenicicoccus dermatophilus]
MKVRPTPEPRDTVTRGRAATWIQRHFGLPGRAWAPSRAAGRLGLVGLGVLILAVWLLGPWLTTIVSSDLAAAAAALGLVWWAVAHPLPLRTAGVRTHAVLDSGVLIVLLTSYGVVPGMGLWLLITVAVELARKHFVAMALANTGISLLASAVAAVVSGWLLGWGPVWTGVDVNRLVVVGATVGAVHMLSEAGITELAVRHVADSHPPTRFRRAGLLLPLGAGAGALAAMCTYSDAPAVALVGLSVPMLLLVTLAHTRAQRRTALARDRILVQALTELARTDDAAGIDAILLQAVPELAPSVACELTVEPPSRGRRSTWFAIGGTGDGTDPATDDRWIRADLLPAEVYLPGAEASALRSLAAVARAAAGRIRERSQMAWEAEHDPLTGLLNRNGYWQRQVDRDDEAGGPLAVVVADLDGFKGVNDAFGHVRGDELLLVVARAIHLTAPMDATVARWGGDEFVIRLEGPRSEVDVAELGRALVAAVERSALEVVPPGLVSASVGYALTDDTARVDPFDLLHHADECMYAAKRAGKATVRGRAA